MEQTSAGYSALGPPASQALRAGGAAEVRAALLAARARTLALAQDWRAHRGDAPVPQADELNPQAWELGHLAWFQEWWLARNPQRALGVRCEPEVVRGAPLLPEADAWYDSSRVPHASRWALPLPEHDATLDYLARTLAQTLALLDALPPAPGDDALYFFRLCALHEQMHAEAACYMAQALGIPLREALVPPALGAPRPLALPAQRFTLGSPDTGFAFDNELGAHAVDIGALEIDAEPVSWERFLPFVEAGGYREPRWWSEDGRAWLATLEQPGPPRLPGSVDARAPALHLNAFEAEAWCRWAGRRLPTEAEWECAALTLPDFRWGLGWEWTASTFAPYPGFTPHPYRDYSAPWFGSHRVLRGASLATAPALAQARYRNFFLPQRRDVFTGFRSCRPGPTV